jgi:putative oxidoreductase
MNGTNNFGALVGRVLLALIFVISGFHKLMAPEATAQMMASHGVPLASVAIFPTILVEFGFSLLLMLGYWTRTAAFLMFLWFIPVTLLFHVMPYRDAVAQQQAQAAAMQYVNFMKNISIMGGMLLLASFGPGAFSLDRRSARNGEADARHAA